MAKKNKRKSNRKSSGFIVNAVCNILCYGIFVALIIAGIAMIYHWGFPFVDTTNYYIICAGSMLIFIGLIFLTAGRVPDTVSTILAGLLLISIGIMHPAVLFLALCGVYVIFDKILIITGHKDVAEKIGGKINAFLRKVFAHKLKVNLEDMNQDARNKALGIKKVNDLSKKDEEQKTQEDTKTPAAAAPIETQATAGVADTIEAPDTPASVNPITEPDRAASEAMARPDPGQFITNFIAGFIFTVGGLMITFSSLAFLFFSSSILEQLPFLLPGGIMLIIGIWQLIKGFKTFAKYSRKD